MKTDSYRLKPTSIKTQVVIEDFNDKAKLAQIDKDVLERIKQEALMAIVNKK